MRKNVGPPPFKEALPAAASGHPTPEAVFFYFLDDGVFVFHDKQRGNQRFKARKRLKRSLLARCAKI